MDDWGQPYPVRYPQWWAAAPTMLNALMRRRVGAWCSTDEFAITPPARASGRYRYIGEMGGGDALMQLLQVVQE